MHRLWIASSVLVVAVLLLLFLFPGRKAQAVDVTVSGLPESLSQGQSVVFSVAVFTTEGERIPIRNVTVSISGPTHVSVIFDPSGTVLVSDPRISSVRMLGSPQFGYGYRYGFDPQLGQGFDFGYGYGYGGPSASILTYEIELLSNSMQSGDYWVEVVVNTGSDVKSHFSSPPVNFSIVSPAPPDERAGSGGVVVPGPGIPPDITCKWELPDMQSGVTGAEYPNPTIQYGTADDPHQHDDDMAMVPDADNDPANGIQVPCSGPPDTMPSMPDGVMHMIQVRPNPEDQPEERWIQLWAAVDHESGIPAIDDVFWVIYHPDGVAKTQVHGTKVEDCAALGSSTAEGTMFEAAYGTGQVAAEAVDDINKGMVAKCQQGEKAIYYAKFSLSKHQPCGKYKIEVHAISGGAEAVLVNYIDVLCTYYMDIDFDDADWGDITPGVKDIVSGDLIFDPDEVPSAPTVKNVGNSGMGVGIHFSEMLQQGVDPSVAKKITQFDACFGKSPATIQCIDPINASEVAWFDEAPARVLCSNDEGKLDLSIHPPSTLPAGRYVGTVDIMAKGVAHARICPTDQGDLDPQDGSVGP